MFFGKTKGFGVFEEGLGEIWGLKGFSGDIWVLEGASGNVCERKSIVRYGMRKVLKCFQIYGFFHVFRLEI